MTRSPKNPADKAGSADDPIVLERLAVDLDELRRRGPGPFWVRADLPTTWLAEVLRDTDASATRAGQARLELVIQGDGTVLLRGPVELAYSVPCARCLDPAQVDAGGELCLTAVPADRLQHAMEAAYRASSDPEGVEIESDDLDQVGYEGHVLDLGRILAEQALLAYPIRALCARGDACEGLCTSCGRNIADVRAGKEPCELCGGDPDRAPGTAGTAGAAGADAAWKAALRKLTRS